LHEYNLQLQHESAEFSSEQRLELKKEAKQKQVIASLQGQFIEMGLLGLTQSFGAVSGTPSLPSLHNPFSSLSPPLYNSFSLRVLDVSRPWESWWWRQAAN
jgi:hypothetical protein